MRDNDNVVARKSFTNNRHIDFKEGKIYRCCVDRKGDKPYYMVYGEWFNEVDFNKNFIPLIDLVKEEFELLGLIENGKPISKTAFKAKIKKEDRCSIHNYVGYRQRTYVIYFYTHPKELIYGFYPSFVNETKKDTIDAAYQNMLNCLGGDVYEMFDESQLVQRGNSGIPIGYGDITWR